MRGIPRKSVEFNTKIEGTNYFARDIADTTSICSWNHQNYGVNMSKPGAQEFYNSLINEVAAWGVDFLKYDDIVPYPEEVAAVARAIDQCNRPILLSLSPGGSVDEDAIDFFKQGNMLRVTHDIWDEQLGIDQCFTAGRKWQGKEEPGFWIDMDMIPFGQLQLMSPKPEGVNGDESKEEILDKQNNGELSDFELLAGKGWTRQSQFSKDQMYTFITLRALSASPLMMGGDLPSLDDFSLKLITNNEVIRCNQNGVMGNLVYEKENLESWRTPERESSSGWIGVFNRSKNEVTLPISKEALGFRKEEVELFDIWSDRKLEIDQEVSIQPYGVIFIRYSES